MPKKALTTCIAPHLPAFSKVNCSPGELYIFLRKIPENRVGPKVYVAVYCNSEDAGMIYD